LGHLMDELKPNQAPTLKLLQYLILILQFFLSPALLLDSYHGRKPQQSYHQDQVLLLIPDDLGLVTLLLLLLLQSILLLPSHLLPSLETQTLHQLTVPFVLYFLLPYYPFHFRLSFLHSLLNRQS